jgi:hypothetical protein
MPGNEKDVITFLFSNRGLFSDPHFGIVNDIECPGKGKLTSMDDCNNISSDDSHKKSDIVINGKGLSIKQEGGTFLYNRRQRCDLIDDLSKLNYIDPKSILQKFDSTVIDVHLGRKTRNRDWEEFFSEIEFYHFVHYLMMGIGRDLKSHLPQLILEAPKANINAKNIRIYTFDDYYNKYKNLIKVSIRRSWVGQASVSEHGRAFGYLNKPNNLPWIFNTISGVPRSGWNPKFPESERKTAYYLMIEKVK